jgi:hypothetical protein
MEKLYNYAIIGDQCFGGLDIYDSNSNVEYSGNRSIPNAI